MFCVNCGARLNLDTARCSACGSIQPSANELQTLNKQEGDQRPSGGRRGWWLWMGMAILAVGGGVVGTFVVMHRFAARAANNALMAAQKGNFALALANQQRAIHWNPGSSGLRLEFSTYSIGLQASEQLQASNKLLSERAYGKAISGYTRVQALLDAHPSALFSTLQTRIGAGLEHANVNQIEEAGAKSSNISTVASYYTQLTSYTDAYGKAAQRQLQGELQSLVTKAVQTKLQADNFGGALQLIQTAIQSIPTDSAWTKLSHQIKADQTAYQLKQQQIQEQSLAQAAKLANLNADPISVTGLSLGTDSFGNVVATGGISNQGTNIIGSIVLTIEFYDSTGSVVDTEYVGVTPDPLNPGQRAAFSVTISQFYNATHASVTYVSWLNE